jgi:hypothetical protein
MLAMLACAGTASMVCAQARLPEPPSAQPTVLRIPNLDPFIDAYKRSGSPKLLIFTDIVGVAGGAAKSINSTAMAARLNSRLQDFFRHSEVFIVSGAATMLKQDQDMEAMRRTDQFAAAKILGSQSGADMVMYVRLLEQEGRRDGVRYTGTYVVADLNRGQSIGSYAWDMFEDSSTGEFDAVRMGDYAYSIANRMASDFITSFPVVSGASALRTFTIRLLGNFEDDDLKGFRDALRSMIAVKPDTVRLGREDSSATTKLTTFELSYAGDLIDLRADIRRSAMEKLFMSATVTSTAEGAISVRLNPVQMNARERLLAGGEENSKNHEERAKLAAAYKKASSPSIAVMVNRVAVAEEGTAAGSEKTAAPVQNGDGTNILIAPRLDLGKDPTVERLTAKLLEREIADRRSERKEDAALDVGMFEAGLAQRLLQNGLKVIDVSVAQTTMMSNPEMKGKAWSDRSLALELGKASGAQISVSGVGKLVRDRSTGKPVRVSFTLTAVKTEGNEVVGAVNVYRDLDPAEESFNQAVDGLVAEATGKLVASLSDVWNR